MAGTYKYGNGDVYEGEWNDDMKLGQGVCLGKVYENHSESSDAGSEAYQPFNISV